MRYDNQRSPELDRLKALRRQLWFQLAEETVMSMADRIKYNLMEVTEAIDKERKNIRVKSKLNTTNKETI
jgi:hypothetical protein